MKTKLQVFALVIILALAGTAGYVAAEEAEAVSATYEPETVPVHPTLLAKYEEFFPAAVLQVTDGVWVARGYNRDNPVLIEGDDGLIVVDPGESIPAAETVKDAFNASLDNIFDRKPVMAIIYTHHHDCHINGASVFADEQTEIIAHESLLDNMFSEWFGPVYPSRVEGGIKMTGIMFQDAPVQDGEGWFVGYGLAGTQTTGPTGFLAPTKSIEEETRLTIAGVDVDLIPVAGETTDVLLVWLPQKEVLIQIAVVYEAFPAISTTRGSRLRDPLDYVNTLKIARGLNPEYLVTIHGPNPVTSGKEDVNQYLTNFSDAIQFVNDQTLYYMNRSYTAGEMMDLIELPPHLASSPYLQEIYGSKEWNIVHIFRYYRGYYTGEVRDLFPQTTQSEAEMSAFLAEGDGDLAAKAQAALEFNPEWALRLADDALLLDPDNSVAFETKKSAMLALAESTMNSQARNMLLSDYLLLTDQANRVYPFGNPEHVYANIDDRFVELMPLATLHRILAVNLNAAKSLETDIVVSLQLTDIEDPEAPDHYTLNVRKGILEVDPPSAGESQFEIVTDQLTWKQLVLTRLSPEEAVANGKVVVSGETPESFYSFMDLFY
ncbi:MAG: alkyl sulfatase dimerization domain-containing protein [Bacillota bacterium]|nr:alkyl sulfatase dimerization domain-containing protein [Bacillota bacterium]